MLEPRLSQIDVNFPLPYAHYELDSLPDILFDLVLLVLVTEKTTSVNITAIITSMKQTTAMPIIPPNPRPKQNSSRYLVQVI